LISCGVNGRAPIWPNRVGWAFETMLPVNNATAIKPARNILNELFVFIFP
jgi:hypothetical protein